MKKILFAISCSLFFISSMAYSANDFLSNSMLDSLNYSKFMLKNNHLGKDFYVTFYPTWALYDSEYRIYVVSLKNTMVTLELPEGAGRTTKQVIPGTATVFTSKKSEINITWNGSESERVTKNGYRLYSDDPVMVYVYIISQDYAGEGYQAIPTEHWGTEYFNFSYYDFMYQGNGMHHPGGFIVIASEPSTQVSIELKGKGNGNVHTQGGKSIGDHLTATLNPGETYLVSGDGTTNGAFLT